MAASRLSLALSLFHGLLAFKLRRWEENVEANSPR